MSKTLRHIQLDPARRVHLLKEQKTGQDAPLSLPVGRTHGRGTPAADGSQPGDGSIFFIGNETTVIECAGLRILTDPNFLHAGDHVHLGPGVTATRLRDPAVDLAELPPFDCILLSHCHEDHFDKLVEASLDRCVPIVRTPHARECPTAKKPDGNKLPCCTSIAGSAAAVKVTAIPGKHVPPGPLALANDVLHALGTAGAGSADSDLAAIGYRIYIWGDTLFVDELQQIPQFLHHQRVDLMLGVRLMHFVNPEVTIPVHFDDYDIMVSPLVDFVRAVEEARVHDRVIYLDRGDKYRFHVRGEGLYGS
ncbi:hypothetical protein B0T24DRAFT_653592 [Lasiosphaeria ovina]|uniref:Metallo-beta-lactamase domain-containing protein n=1 Tax=Lasiosphaeria ovina TaxID=92902 RepID=A0AAE0NJ83_9PEZI|nr:hypothetical protein B0T24DRAFT_653592 [Lasiosphaeria ovina]